MDAEVILTVAALAIVALLSAAGVFSARFDDTLLQRLALGGICVGSLACAAWLWRLGQVPHGISLLSTSAALFAAETARKLLHRRGP